MWDSLSDAGGAFWEGVGGKALTDIVMGASRNPDAGKKAIETAKGLVEGIRAEPGRVWSELSETGKSLLHGHPADAAFHAAGSIPLVGAPAQQVGVDFDNGDYAKGFGHALGLLLPFAAHAVAPKIGGEGKLIVPSSLNPVQQTAVDFLQERGVPLKAGTVTGNKFLKSFESVAAASPLGSVTAGEAARATESGLTRVAGELADQAHPTPVRPETAGRAVSTAFDKKIEGLNFDEQGAYKQAWQHVNNPAFTYEVPVKTPGRVPVLGSDGRPTGEFAQAPPVMKKVNMPVDVRDIKDSLKQVYEDMQWMPAAERSASAGYQAVKKILEGDDFIPAPAAERGLSGLKTLARVDNPNLRNVGQGIAARIIPDLQEQVDAAVAHTGDDAFRGLQRGRAVHASKMEIADIADKLREEPVQTFKQITWENDTGIDFLRKIKDHAPDKLPQVGRAFVDQLFDKATKEGGFNQARSIFNEWECLGPETKKLLFPDSQLRGNLDNFFRGADQVADNPNPSGTAIVSSATSMNPFRWLAGYAGSKLLFTPRGVALLTEATKPAVMANPAATQAVRMQLLRMMGRAGALNAAKDQQ